MQRLHLLLRILVLPLHLLLIHHLLMTENWLGKKPEKKKMYTHFPIYSFSLTKMATNRTSAGDWKGVTFLVI